MAASMSITMTNRATALHHYQGLNFRGNDDAVELAQLWSVLMCGSAARRGYGSAARMSTPQELDVLHGGWSGDTVHDASAAADF